MRAISFVDNPSCSQNTNNGRVLTVTVERCIIIIMLVMPLRRVDDRPWHVFTDGMQRSAILRQFQPQVFFTIFI